MRIYFGGEGIKTDFIGSTTIDCPDISNKHELIDALT